MKKIIAAAAVSISALTVAAFAGSHDIALDFPANYKAEFTNYFTGDR